MKKAISEEKVKILREVLFDRAGEKDFQALLCLIILETGSRSCEVLDLSQSELRISDNRAWLNIKAAKKSNNRQCLISHELSQLMPIEPISSNFKSCKASVLRQLRRYFSRLTDNVIKEKRSLHELRHSWISKIYELSQYDIKKTQLAAGHKSINSTAIYINAGNIIETNILMENRWNSTT